LPCSSIHWAIPPKVTFSKESIDAVCAETWNSRSATANHDLKTCGGRIKSPCACRRQAENPHPDLVALSDDRGLDRRWPGVTRGESIGRGLIGAFSDCGSQARSMEQVREGREPVRDPIESGPPEWFSTYGYLVTPVQSVTAGVKMTP